MTSYVHTGSGMVPAEGKYASYAPKFVALEDYERVLDIVALLAPLVHGFAEWERVNGSASAISGNQECMEIADIVERWALLRSFRKVDGDIAALNLKERA